mmetsp:Transcript_10488/g.25542  ORF Transcript_10488/g.25542 Transcript_10488/m.25542 type:complete len:252 (+) Transcript_10488:857-1612(+)
MSSVSSLFGHITVHERMGVRSEMPRLSRAVRPVCTSDCIRRTLSSMRSSTSARSASGNGRKCTESMRCSFGTRSRRFLYSSSQKSGVKGAMQRTSVISTPNSTLMEVSASLMPLPPLSRFRFIFTYQLVRSSMKRSRRGTTVYSLYAFISAPTNLIRFAPAAWIHLSMRLSDAMLSDILQESTMPSSRCSRRTCCTRKRYALYHGSMTSRTTSLTPSSLKRSSSARTTGELIRYMRRASAPWALITISGSG